MPSCGDSRPFIFNPIARTEASQANSSLHVILALYLKLQAGRADGKSILEKPVPNSKRMNMKKKILAICGSARAQSANLTILQWLKRNSAGKMEWEIYTGLLSLPHFNPDLDKEKAPGLVEELREKIKNADGVFICTPEYVFSLPGALKNAIEWCVSTTVFSEKPVALITASASGLKGHEALLLVMRTIYADLRSETQLLIQGAKGRVNDEGDITDPVTVEQLTRLLAAFEEQVEG
jgi:chromate reductase